MSSNTPSATAPKTVLCCLAALTTTELLEAPEGSLEERGAPIPGGVPEPGGVPDTMLGPIPEDDGYPGADDIPDAEDSTPPTSLLVFRDCLPESVSRFKRLRSARISEACW